MAYKNTDTNPSANKAFYQWNYFSSALGKIGTIGNNAPNIQTPTMMVEKEKDWMDTAAEVTTGAVGLYQTFQEQSYKEADEYFKSHSLEEYNQQLKEGLVPFQWNPVAMARLKYNHGKEVANLASAEFSERIKNGEFVGKSPEEVQAALYKHMRHSRDELKDTFDYANENDHYFNEGMFENSDAARLQASTENLVVDNNAKKEEAIRTEVTNVIEYASGETATADGLVETLNNSHQINGFYWGHEGDSKMISTALETLAGQPNRTETLLALKDKEIPWMKGVTFGELYGEGGFKKLLLSTANHDYDLHEKEYTARNEMLRDYAETGKVLKLKELEQNYLDQNGGVEDEYVKEVRRAISKAEVNQLAQAKAAQKKTEEIQGVREVYKALMQGYVVPKSTIEQYSAEAYKQVFDASIAAGDPLFNERSLWILASNTSAQEGRAAVVRNYYKGQVSTAMNTIRSWENALASGQEAAIPEHPEDYPAELTQMMAMARKHPEDFQVGTGCSEAEMRELRVLNNLTDSGMSLKNAIKSKAAWNEISSAHNRRYDPLYKTNMELQKVLGSSTKDMDGYAKQVIGYTAAGYIKYNQSPDKAVEMAIKDFSQSHVLINKNTLPRHIFKTKDSVNGVGAFQAFLKHEYGKDVENIRLSYHRYGADGYAVRLYKDGKPLKEFTKGEIGTMIDSYEAAERQKFIDEVNAKKLAKENRRKQWLKDAQAGEINDY